MKRTLLPCLLLLFFAFTAFGQTRVCTYNIRNSHAADGVNKWPKRKAALFALIKKVSPDILGTQEVLLNQLKDLKGALKEYEVFGVGRNDGKHSGEHSPVFYRKDKFEFLRGGNFWLSQTPAIPGSKSWDAAITRICSWVELKERASGKTLFVFNTHFDHKGKEARRKSAALLRQTIDSLAVGAPVIVTGDFNFTPDDAAYAIMTTPGAYNTTLNDSYTTGSPNFTDCGFEVSNTNCHRIDYIFFSQPFNKSNYTLYTDNNGSYYPSDHLTISIDLK
ncbi:MAG: endonuclease/exonuclease/phosphatase family protein [Chitinophagales bacterium]|nr:endonuclease/exonuclease/phosphatase family protein [Chitinophagales bacterium]